MNTPDERQVEYRVDASGDDSADQMRELEDTVRLDFDKLLARPARNLCDRLSL
jgi:hypothetical protein